MTTRDTLADQITLYEQHLSQSASSFESNTDAEVRAIATGLRHALDLLRITTDGVYGIRQAGGDK